MNAGSLRHRVIFDEPMTSQNDSGEEIVNFVQAFILWASIEPLKGRERLLSSGILAEQDTRIRLRVGPQSSRITAKWRARHQGIVFNLGPPAQIGYLGREIEIMASSGVNNG